MLPGTSLCRARSKARCDVIYQNPALEGSVRVQRGNNVNNVGVIIDDHRRSSPTPGNKLTDSKTNRARKVRG